MVISERHEPLLQFSRLQRSVQARCSNSALALRPFGLYESDLNVDFSHPFRPFLVQDILECCASNDQKDRVEQSFLWNLPIGKRIECLLTLLPQAGARGIPLVFCCPEAECGEESEVEISVREIEALQAQAYETEPVLVPIENGALVLRRPTGSDQLIWLKSRFADKDSATEGMLRTLLLECPPGTSIDGDAIPGALILLIERTMEEFDPLVNFSQRVKCFSCEAENLLEIDLEALSLRQLQQAQMRLLASVHKLAAHYHWSEQEIFSIPYWRRNRYLSLIEKEKNQ